MNKGILIVVVVLMVAALVGLGWIVAHRSQPAPASGPPSIAYSSNQDDYVFPHKIYAYDLRSAKKELAGKTVWVKPDNSLSYYQYGSGLQHKAGVLASLEKLEIQDLALQKTSGAATHVDQIVIVKYEAVAVFRKAGQPATYVVPIGGGSQFRLNEEFFIDDPHELYKHWPPDVWTAIDRHEARPGMSELQVSFALGASSSSGGGPYGNRTMKYANAGNPVSVRFAGNKAVEIVPGTSK